MYKLLTTAMLLIPFCSLAQNGMPMDDAQMQQMMQQAESMQNCMANIDEAEMQSFQQKAEAMDIEVKTLCAAGKRDAAMARAMAFGKEAAQSKIMQEMKNCGEGMKNMMPTLPKTAQAHDDSHAPKHICDK